MAFVFKHLPEEIIVDIFSRLPLKYLVRCRAVAKPWLHFLTISTFPQWLLQRHISCDPLIPCPHDQSFLMLTYDTHGYIDNRPECKLLAMGGGSQERNFRVASEINSPLIRGKISYQIKTACCNGLLCLLIDDDNSLVLWNPSTGGHKSIPVPEVSYFPRGVCGLGYDPVTDDYKVVTILHKKVMHVFSVKNNHWRRIGDFPNMIGLPYVFFEEGIPINGSLYWTGTRMYKIGDLIIRLNLSNNRLTEVPLPPYEWKQEKASCKLMTELNLLAWGNSLCVHSQFDQSMWVLKEDEDRENGGIRYIWTHMMTLPKISYHDYLLQPRCFTKSGKLVVFVKSRNYVLFDGRGYEDLHVEGLVDSYHSSVVYNQSLISPQFLGRN
ncbi:F-box protein CPR1-like [Euphorbia lathyris]|uniref:F-box protein CPR1-like n=1 Tax=Euphorbia lathyris TaxID=212925 RepID=UPI003313FC2E